MDEIELLYRVGLVGLVIPAWQMGFYVGLISISMLLGRYKLCLMTTYVFTFYWGFYLAGKDFVEASGGSLLPLMVYIICGLSIALLALVAFFQEK